MFLLSPFVRACAERGPEVIALFFAEADDDSNLGAIGDLLESYVQEPGVRGPLNALQANKMLD